jgi:hypothetical protein
VRLFGPGYSHLAPLAGRGRIASAIRVRGSLRKRGGNRFENACHIGQYVVVPKPQDAIVALGEPSVPCTVTSAIRMLPAVHFNNQSALAADKINRVWSDRLLSDKLVAAQPSTAKAIPECRFRIRRSASQMSRPFGLELIGTAHAETPPHPSRFARRPLPASGER